MGANGNAREISIFTPEMVAISHIEPKVLHSDRARICSHSPINVIGALLVARHLSQFQQIYLHDEGTIPEAFYQPVSLLYDVPLSLYKEDKYVDTGIQAQSVLMKNVCGKHVGVVLQGGLSGLMLAQQDGLDHQEGLAVGRVWNSGKIFPGSMGPYQFAIREHAKIEDYPPAIVNSLNMLFAQYRDCEQPTEEIFFDLCHGLDIPVDREQFAVTSTLITD